MFTQPKGQTKGQKTFFLVKICFSLCTIINKSQMHPSEKITKQLTVRGGSTLTVSLTVKYPFFFLTASLRKIGHTVMVSKQSQIWRKWKWSPVVKRGEMNLFWCIFITNNVKSCTKFDERAQTANFSVLSKHFIIIFLGCDIRSATSLSHIIIMIT